MKKIIISSAIIFLFFGYLLPKKTLAQSYIIPGALQQPAWVFPLYIEEGNGQMDTIYFGYDPQAEDWAGGNDSVFGERWISKDTSKFFAYWYSCCNGISDTVMNVTIFKQPHTYGFAESISLHKAVLPITIKFNPLALHSDSLPFINQDPAPRAQGELWYSDPAFISGCSYQFPVLLTDSSNTICSFDSLVYFIDLFGGNETPFTSFTIYIKPWSGYFLSVNEISIGDNSDLFPNPFKQTASLLIQNKNYQIEDLFVLVYNVFGDKVKITNIIFKENNNIKFTFQRSNLINGIYFYSVFNKGVLISSGKFITQ